MTVSARGHSYADIINSAKGAIATIFDVAHMLGEMVLTFEIAL